jgi:predicted heme/steroid binding protein
VTQEKTFTAADLALYNGKNGARAYIAYQGKVYDVTDSPLWTDGDHLGAHQAGMDLTAELEAAPHGADNLEQVPVVGVLAS